jgi:DNA repair protein RecN (Recombination protein N)
MPLRRLSLRDFVIVDALDLDFQSGFTALTGETGAGKSILIDAIQLVLGQRADADVLRQGAARCEISAEFDTPASLQAWLQEQGFEGDDDGSLLLRRHIDAQGRSRGWINGSAATMAQLKSTAEHLIDIHGQHAWHTLTRAQAQLDLLDAYAQTDLQPMQAAWAAWREVQRLLTQALSDQAQITERRDRLQWQIAELDKLNPGPNEWDELNEEHTRLSHVHTLIETAQWVVAHLDEEPLDINKALTQAARKLTDQARYEPRFGAWAQTLQDAQALLSDALHDLHSYARHTDLEPERLAVLDDRMALWLSLSKRFHTPAAELAALHQQWREALSQLEAQADIGALQSRASALQAAWAKAAQKVSAVRLKASQKLATEVTQIMQRLGLDGGHLAIEVQGAEPQASGQDEVAFLVAGHAGVSPKPVAKVASGGELSRIALAIAVCTSRLGSASTLVFDEVDAGIGGRVANTVGELMRQLGSDRQVLAVTHLAQVAATAHHHLKVSKHQSRGETLSTIEPLQDHTRVAEIARMLGGTEDSDTVLAHAREILQA